MRSLISFVDVVVSAVVGGYVYLLAIIVAWFLGSAVGVSMSSRYFGIGGILFSGVATFCGGLFLPPFYFLNWPLLAAAFIVGFRTENRPARLALLPILIGWSLWSGYALGQVRLSIG